MKHSPKYCRHDGHALKGNLKPGFRSVNINSFPLFKVGVVVQRITQGELRTIGNYSKDYNTYNKSWPW